MDSEGQNPDFNERRRGGNDFDPSLYKGSGSDSAWGNKMRSDAADGPTDGFDDRRENAKDFARFGEEGAAKTGSAAGQNGVGNSPFSSALSNTRDAEKRGGFANNVKGKTLEQAAGAAMPGGKKALAQVKKFGPLGGILAMIATLVMIFAGTQSLAPFGLIANGLDQFNNLRTSMNKRSTYFNRFMLDNSRNYEITKAPIFGKEKFKVSNSLSKKLQKNGISYIDGDTRFLVYQDPTTGKTYGVAANDDDVGSIPRTAEIPDGNGGMKTVEIDSVGKIDDVMNESGNFKSSLDKGTRTLKGHVAGWFDNLSTILHGSKRLNNSRDRFKDTSDVASDEEIMGKAKSIGMDEDIKPDNTDAKEAVEELEYNDDGTPKLDENGQVVKKDVPVDMTEADTEGVKKADVVGLDPDSEVVTDKINKSIKGKVSSVVASATTAINYACTAMKAISAINLVMSAIHVANVINYVTGFLEAVQRTQAGDAGENELSYYMTRLSEKGVTYGVHEGEVIRDDSSSLESPAWNQFFSSGAVVVQPDDAVAQKFNREYIGTNAIKGFMSKITGGGSEDEERGYEMILHGDERAPDNKGLDHENFGAGITSAGIYKKCLYANIIGNAFTMAMNFFTGGGASIVKSIKKLLFQLFGRVALTAAITAIMSFAIPHIAKLMTRDLIAGMAGEDAAYAINSGFNMYLGAQMQMSSGLPATSETLASHWRAQQEVIASEAEYERSQRSPFDPTSKYTFIGSIVNSLMPIANTWSSPLMVMSKTMNTVGSAFSNVLPTAKADGETKFETSLKYDCPNLSEIGLVGDAYCTPYFVTDTSTMEEDPAEVFRKVDEDVVPDCDLGVTDINDCSDEVVEEETEVGDAIDGTVTLALATDKDKNIKLAARIRAEDLIPNQNFEDEPDENGNAVIREKSKLGKWIISCASRGSQFGIVDDNVMGNITMLRTGNDVVDGIANNSVVRNVIQQGVGMIPYVGEMEEIAASALELANYDWATGARCIDEDYKYYSRYAEDQRLMESAGIIEESAVSKFLNEYYEKHPIDNSYEGTIARLSGLSKEKVAEVFDIVDGLEWIANYNPTRYGPEEYVEPDNSYQFESTELVASEKVILLKNVVYEDLRTKVKVA